MIRYKKGEDRLRAVIGRRDLLTLAEPRKLTTMLSARPGVDGRFI
jgi:hypothetical protein